MSATAGERKCALLLSSLRKRDRQQLLARLPMASARSIRALVAELEALPFAAAALADELLADEVVGLTARTSLELDQLVALSRRLPPSWFARVLSVWAGVDRKFCLAMLDADVGAQARRELERMPPLPPKLVEAIRVQAIAMAAEPVGKAAA